jgi:hypothetical protein
MEAFLIRFPSFSRFLPEAALLPATVALTQIVIKDPCAAHRDRHETTLSQ